MCTVRVLETAGSVENLPVQIGALIENLCLRYFLVNFTRIL